MLACCNLCWVLVNDMKIKKTFFFILTVIVVLLVWFWLDQNDYFNTYYNDLTDEQKSEFKWKPEYSASGKELKDKYRSQFSNDEFKYPRQHVESIKMYKNIPILNIFTGRYLNAELSASLLNFCNNPDNFDWGETTWGIHEAEYFFKLYNKQDQSIGKIYFCLDGCGQVFAEPFSPRMKFGGLSKKGLMDISGLIRKINQP